ncbi:MAG: A/G-specific adenine glycosylase [Alphaproteobacteria bacterium]|nr:A/G-specific adenine glycosylase [Alphaproteobacteria bacterium]
MTTTPDTLAARLLHWHARSARDGLPWRDAPCGRRDPYRVWLAEIMLQQTTCAAVIPYFRTFLRQWPDVKALARADDEAVMRAWAGLGYYARARNLLKCARVVAGERQGAFPMHEDDLRRLPGIGDYTAAAVAAIAHNGPAAPVDGNVVRVLSRLYAIDAIMPGGKTVVADHVRAMLPEGRSGDFAEAMMDLGATVCRPKNPDCAACPWSDACRARAQGETGAYPRKAPKKDKPTRRGWVFWLQGPDGRVLLERRAERGLLGGMLGFPTTEWAETAPDAALAAAHLPNGWRVLDGRVHHTFTHFHLELGVIAARLDDAPEGAALWRETTALEGEALPTVMKKVARLAQK